MNRADAARAIPREQGTRSGHRTIAGYVRGREGSVTTAKSGVADVLIVGGVYTVLVPVLDVLDGCDWAVGYQASAAAAADWLTSNRALVAIVEADENWQEVMSRLRQVPNVPKIVVAAREQMPVEEFLRAGAHDTLCLPLESYDLLWTLVTTWHEAQNECRPPLEVRDGCGATHQARTDITAV